MDNQQDKKIRNFRLSLIDALSHERLWSLRFSRTTFIVAAISAVVIVVVGLYCLIAYTPIRTFIPGYPDAHSRRQAVQNSLRIRWKPASCSGSFIRRTCEGWWPGRLPSAWTASSLTTRLPAPR